MLRNAANTRCVKASGSCFSHHLTSSHVASSRESLCRFSASVRMHSAARLGRCSDGTARTDRADAVGTLACAWGVGMSSSGVGCPICVVRRRFVVG